MDALLRYVRSVATARHGRGDFIKELCGRYESLDLDVNQLRCVRDQTGEGEDTKVEEAETAAAEEKLAAKFAARASRLVEAVERGLPEHRAHGAQRVVVEDVMLADIAESWVGFLASGVASGGRESACFVCRRLCAGEDTDDTSEVLR